MSREGETEHGVILVLVYLYLFDGFWKIFHERMTSWNPQLKNGANAITQVG